MRLPVFAAACLLGGCSSVATDSAAPPSGNDPTTVETSGVGSPIEVYDRLVREAQPDENVVYSPTSVAQALGLVHLGSAGATRGQIEQFLAMGADEAGDRMLAARAERLQDTERGVTVNIANTLFLSEDWRFRPTFLQTARQIYGAEPNRVDFLNNPGGAAETINAWAARETKGLIPKVVSADSIQREAAAYLANATYFEAEWTQSFKVSQMRPFLFGDGRERPFRLMKNEGQFATASMGEWRGLRMTYGFEKRRFAFDVMIPSRRVADAEAPTHAAIEAMATALSNAAPSSVRLWLPRFEADMQANLIPPLRATGLTLPFDRNRADLSAMAEPGQRQLYIGEAFQAAKLQVYENGTKAAAVTMMVAMPVSAPPPFEGSEFVVDRPFVFAIRDLETGEILFLGRIADPKPFTLPAGS